MRSLSVPLLLVLAAVCALICVSSPMYACHPRPPIEIVYGPGVAGGQEVSGTVPLVAEVKNSKTAVSAVDFLVDGTLVATDKSADEKGQYTAEWDTTKLKDGEHTLTLKGTLADGKALASKPLTVVVKNVSSE